MAFLQCHVTIDLRGSEGALRVGVKTISTPRPVTRVDSERYSRFKRAMNTPQSIVLTLPGLGLKSMPGAIVEDGSASVEASFRVGIGCFGNRRVGR
jgi:hypothetical protein